MHPFVRYRTYEEFVDPIAASGGKWIFMGMESIDPANLADVSKGFNKTAEYAAVLQRLAGAQRLRIKHKPLGYPINNFIARMCFLGIYFPRMGPLAWLKLIYQNRRTIFALLREGFTAWRGHSARSASAGA